MNKYWLSRDGGSSEGPFAESQLLNMWNAGGITAAAQVCLEGTDDWIPASMIVDEKDTEIKKEEAKRAGHARRLELARAEYEHEKKSAGVAMLMSALLPCGGQFYAGATMQGILGILFGLALLVFFPMGIWIVWVAAIADAPGAVKRYNKALSARLGIF